VLLGIGTNKRFWLCMREQPRVVDSGVLGRLLHIEGRYGNENTRRHFSSWRANPAEAPAAVLTGWGIHLLDALVSYAGGDPLHRVLLGHSCVRRPGFSQGHWRKRTGASSERSGAAALCQ